MHLTDAFKIMPHYLLPKKSLTLLAGSMANVRQPAIKNRLIDHFIKRYQINMAEALYPNSQQYATFNEFFIRQLKPDCRSIANATIVSPIDGYVSEIGQIHNNQLIQAKGRYYDVATLLASSPDTAKRFDGGLFSTLYLSPSDYHRVHMPITGTLQFMTYIPGKLFSVQPLTTRLIPKLFARNERLVVFFNTEIGLMAMVLVGATIVGAIGTPWTGDIIRSAKKRTLYSKEMVLAKGTEMGYFKLGSTVILLFEKGAPCHWQENLTPGKKIQLGQALV